MRGNKAYYQIKDLFPHLKNPSRYKGTLPITLRSGWEITFATKFLDTNPGVLEWSSESVVIPYIDPVDKRQHRYFVDFWMRVKAADGQIYEYLIEIKPHSQTLEPKPRARITPRFKEEVRVYLKNQAKWAAARHLCEQQRKLGKRIEFQILTEKDLPV